MFNVRLGLSADWDRVFAVAAEEDVIVELDCTINRQDLNVALATEAARYNVRFSLGSDSHSPYEVQFMNLGLATAIAAGIPKERIVNVGAPGAWKTRR